MQTQHPASNDNRQELQSIGQRHGFGIDAVESMLESLRRGGGTMAQFSHPEFSGSGQWMRGGMTMVSDMFNHQLKSRVTALCDDLSAWLARNPQQQSSSSSSQGGGSSSSSSSTPRSSGNWWPAEFSNPSSSGSQNDQRYAYFPDQRRLVVDDGGEVSVYDTQGHSIHGVSQQQSGRGTMTFQSQHGTVNTLDLPLVSRSGSRR